MTFGEIITIFANASIFFIFMTLFVILITTLLNAIRYKLIANELFAGYISILNSFFVICASQFSNYILPLKTGVIVIKPWLTKKYSELSLEKSFVVTGFEQFFEIGFQMLMLPFLLYLLGDILLFKSLSTKIISLSCAIFIILICVFNYKQIIKFSLKFIRFTPKRFRDALEKRGINERSLLNTANQAISSISNLSFFIKLNFWTILLVIVSPFIITTVTYAFNATIPYKEAFLIYWVSMIIGRLSGLPGGLGVRDITMAGLLISFGFNAQLTLSITLFYRILVILFYAITGAPLMLKIGKSLATKIYKKQKG